MAKPISSAVIMYISVMILRIIMVGLDPVLRLSLLVLIGVAAYGSMIFTLDRNMYNELIGLMSIKNQKKDQVSPY